MSRRNRLLALLGFFIILGAAFLGYYYKEFKAAPKTLAVVGNPGHTIEAFSFTDQNGATVTEKDVAGKIFVVEYFFTTCKGICPKMNDNMARVYAAFRGNDGVKILSHTVTPQIDSAPVLRAYAERYEADPVQWKFLTGPKQELYQKAEDSYLISALENQKGLSIEEKFLHDKHFVLVDRQGRLRGKFYDGTNPGEVQQLIGDIKELLKEKEEPESASSEG